MIIKLTNMGDEYEGKPLLINSRHILTMFEVTRDVKNKKKTVETITNIYSITQQSWQVKESLEYIYKLLERETNE